MAQGKPPQRLGLRLLVIGGVVAAIILAAASVSPRTLTGWDESNLLRLAIVAMLCVLALAESRRSLGTMARQAAIWLILGMVLLVGYSYRDDINGILGRMSGTLVPSRGVAIAPGILRFSADDGGQFFVDAVVNRTRVHFLIDTGASGIALSQRDALRVGFRPGELAYTARFQTANGTVGAAPVMLDTMSIGSMTTNGVQAWVNQGDIEMSLLGMSFLSKVGRIEIDGDTLTLDENQQ